MRNTPKMEFKHTLNTLTETLKILNKVDLIESYEDFSKNFADRSSGWLSYQIHKNRDFGIETAINALKETRRVKTFYLGKRQRLGSLVDDTIEALEQVERLIQAHLEEQYDIIQIKQ